MVNRQKIVSDLDKELKSKLKGFDCKISEFDTYIVSEKEIFVRNIVLKDIVKEKFGIKISSGYINEFVEGNYEFEKIAKIDGGCAYSSDIIVPLFTDIISKALKAVKTRRKDFKNDTIIAPRFFGKLEDKFFGIVNKSKAKKRAKTLKSKPNSKVDTLINNGTINVKNLIVNNK